MFLKNILFITILLSLFATSTFTYADEGILNDLKSEAVENDKEDKNKINLNNEQKYINAAPNVMEKRCREKDLSEYDCKRLIRAYETKQYLEQRNMQTDLDSQEHAQ
jgi:hypothetical protein